MAEFEPTYGDPVRVSDTAPAEARPGTSGWVVALPSPADPNFTVEFADGTDIQIRVEHLRPEADAPSR